jgi:toluene monooxygenase system ferredoxin subunit
MGETATTPQWLQVSTTEDLWEGEMSGVEVKGKKILLVNADGCVHAFHDRCPHQQWPLHNGDFANGILTCAQHLWQFDVSTGKGVNPSTCELLRYPCKVDEAGNIHVAVE